MAKTRQLVDLLKLTGLQIGGFILFELMVWLLVLTGVLPAMLTVTTVDGFTFGMNTAYIVLIGLFSVLVAAFWLAILVEFELVELDKVDIGF